MLYYLLAAYGMTFYLQNKATLLHGRLDLLDKALSCTFCCGFWTGLATWGAAWGVQGEPLAAGLHAIPSALVMGFCSAGFSYSLDAGVRYLEANTAE
jgi:hypothetical protein